MSKTLYKIITKNVKYILLRNEDYYQTLIKISPLLKVDLFDVTVELYEKIAKDDPEKRKKFVKFFDLYLGSTNNPDEINRITDALKKKKHMSFILEKHKRDQTTDKPTGKALCIYDSTFEEIGNCLTLYCSQLLKNIKYYDVMRAITSNNLKVSPELQALVDISNDLSYFIPFEVLRFKKIEEQKSCFKFFVNLATYLREVNNFHCLYAVLSGLNNRWLEKLQVRRRTSVSSQLISLTSIIDFSMNSLNYRTIMKNIINEPVVPYMGIILQDITMYLEHEFVDREKRKLIKKSIDSVSRYIESIESLNYDYDLKTNISLVDCIESLKIYNMDEITDLYDQKINKSRSFQERISSKNIMYNIRRSKTFNNFFR